jgi:hypothetical protein
MGLTRREILRQIDWVGGLLSIGGIICFLMSLQCESMHEVLFPLILTQS